MRIFFAVGIAAALLPPASLSRAEGAAAISRPAADIVQASEFGALGNGVDDDTAALQRALNSGKPVFLAPGKTYSISSRLTVPSHGGILGDGTAEVVARSSGFTNADPTGRGRYRPHSNVIDASGSTSAPFVPKQNIVFRGFRLRYEWAEGRHVDGIVARNVEGLTVEHVDITGFPAGVGVRVASVRGKSSIVDNHIHDFSSNTVFVRSFPGSIPQLTAIEVDNDLVNGVGTMGLVIARNRIVNIVVGKTFNEAQGYQSDGINIASEHAERLLIEDNEISNTGEGIDHFGVNGTIRRNSIADSYQFGIKLIHGASHNIVSENTVLRSGLAGIVLAGSASAKHGTEFNTIADNIISELDPAGTWAPHDTSCIQLSDNNATVHKVRNNVIVRNRLLPGPNGMWAINRGANSGGNNDVQHNRFEGKGRRGLVSPGDVVR